MTKKSKITTLSLASATSIIPILTAQSCKNNDENILLIAHRGAPGGNNTKNTYQFECSKEAYEAAAKQSNIWGLETDVLMTADNFNSSNDGYTNVEPKWICVHDDTPFAITATNNIRDDDTYSAGIPADNLNGTHVNTLSKGLNSNILPSKFFPDFDSTNQQHSIIQFDEYLDICKKYNKQAIIEIKEPNHLVGSPDGDSAKPYHWDVKGNYGYLCSSGWDNKEYNFLPELWKKICDHNMEKNCTIISLQECYIRWFLIPSNTQVDGADYSLNDHHQLQVICGYHVSNPWTDNSLVEDIVRGITFGEPVDVTVDFYQSAWLNNLFVIKDSEYKEWINLTHKNGRKFGVWTVDIKDDFNFFKKAGADYITTNYYHFVDSKYDIPEMREKYVV